MGRPATTHDNTAIKAYLNETGIINYFELPRWVDDCFSGSSGQVSGTQKFSPATLFNIVRSLDTISSDTVESFLNRKRKELNEPPVSTRYCQYVAKAARCASQAIGHHRNYNKIEPVSVLPEFKPLPYTDDEFACLKYLSLYAPHSELVEYEKLLKEQYNIA